MKRTDLSPRVRPALAFFVACLLAACAPLPAPAPQPRPIVIGGAQREAAMNRQWQNHRMSELVSALGTPTMVMNIPGGGNPPGFALVFGRDRDTGCIDAFAMMYGADPVVRSYYCR